MTYPPQPGYDPNAGYVDPNAGYVDPVTGQPAYPVVDPGALPGYPVSGQPAYGVDPASGQPAYGGYPGYGQPAYPGYPGYPPAPVSRPTNGMAIAALVLGISGVATCGVSGLVGAILGHVARRQIKQSGQDGDGMALGGIISGWITFGLALLIGAGYIVFIVFLVSAAANNPNPYNTY